jgi:hypothetical protein
MPKAGRWGYGFRDPELERCLQPGPGVPGPYRASRVPRYAENR